MVEFTKVHREAVREATDLGADFDTSVDAVIITPNSEPDTALDGNSSERQDETPCLPPIEPEVMVQIEEMLTRPWTHGKKLSPETNAHNRAILREALLLAARGYCPMPAHRPHPRFGYTANWKRLRYMLGQGLIPTAEDMASWRKKAKMPVGDIWQKRASSELEAVWVNFNEYPAAIYKDKIKTDAYETKFITFEVNLCIVTGLRTGYCAIDIDKEFGRANWAALIEQNGEPPRTVQSLSGSGKGDHLLFRLPDGVELHNTGGQFGALSAGVSVGMTGTQIDVRSLGGQIIVAPSEHDSGGTYTWVNSPHTTPLADIPEWLVQEAIRCSKIAQREQAERDGTAAPKGPRRARTPVEDDDGPDTYDDTGTLPGGWRGHVARVGYGEGTANGCHYAIQAAGWSFFQERGHTADSAPLYDALLERLKVVAKDYPDKASYIQELKSRIEDARRTAEEAGFEATKIYGFESHDEGTDIIKALNPTDVEGVSLAIKRLLASDRLGPVVCGALRTLLIKRKLVTADTFKEAAANERADARNKNRPTESDGINWPDGYMNVGDRLCFIDADNNATPLCRALEPVATVYDEKGTGFGKLYTSTNTLNEPISFVIKDSELVAGSDGALYGRLSELGLEIDGDKINKAQLNCCLTRVRVDRHMLRATRAGWHDDVFIPGSDPEPDEGEVRSRMLTEGARFKDRKAGGSLAGWKDMAKLAFTVPENFHWPLGLMAGFAGPVAGLLDIPSQAICLSGASSVGKTTALIMGVSVHGNPRAGKSCLFSMNTTQSALENLSVRGHHQVIAFDELALAPANALRAMVYQFAEGQGKERAKPTEGENRDGVEWRSFGMFSTETPLLEIIESAGQSHLDGMTVRVPDIGLSGAIAAKSVADALREGARSNYGHSIGPFIAHLHSAGYVADPETLRARITAAAVAFVGDDPSPLKMRAAMVFALLGVAGSIAVDAELLPDDADVVGAIEAAWAAYQAGAGAAGLDRKVSVVAALQRSMAKRLGVDILDTTEDGWELNGRPRSSYVNGKVWSVPKGNLVDLAACGLGEEEIVAALDGEGWIIRRMKDKRLWSDKVIPGTKLLVPHWRIALKPFLGIDAPEVGTGRF